MILITALYFSFLLTTLLVLLFMKIGIRLGLMIDQPNSRKVHTEPIPRTGGPAVMVGCLLPLIIFFRGERIILGLCLGAICILVTGIIDDLWNLNYKWKFLGQGLAATLALLLSGIRLHSIWELWQGFPLDLGSLSLPLGIFFLVATTNMINLSDGLDGLAGGICFLVFCAIGFLAIFQADDLIVALCICTIGAIAGFLRYNTHPAIVFMGDTGSQFLGFTAGFSIILLTQTNTVYSPAIALYLLGIPIIDTITVIFERIRKRIPVFKADKNHIHHKLLRLGLRHNESVMVIYSLQFGMILIAWTGRYADNAVLLVSFLLITGLSIYFFTLGSRITWVVQLANDKSKPNPVKKRGAEYHIFSRKTISELTWYGLICILIFFYLISPFLLGSIPKAVGFFSLGMIVSLLLLKKFNISYISIILVISFYFLGLYYIFFTEYSQDSILIMSAYRMHYNVLFCLIGMCYIGHVISGYKTISFSTNDFLLLAVVIFLFFLPKSYAWTIHLRSIAVKSFLLLICIQLIFKKVKTKINFALTPVILAFGLNSIIAFLPFIM
jgi:UDP-GlcNAc:undecaprenyl-phosphate GlcNAc-1-phosphate transferase